jgi:hypothetical protein
MRADLTLARVQEVRSAHFTADCGAVVLGDASGGVCTLAVAKKVAATLRSQTLAAALKTTPVAAASAEPSAAPAT